MNDLTLRLNDHHETSAPERALVYEIRNQVRTHNARLDGMEPDLASLFRGIEAYLITLRTGTPERQYLQAKRISWRRANDRLELIDYRTNNRLILTVSQLDTL
ncbi:hypothetical protein [uncultured Fibrella sp.]|uniref:hypothetical protein n=1 Tax=uncultured Fibrella sp. TaxID=1284596 RepID=UPI0035C9BF81